jgi:HNH endonuclease
MQIPDIGPKLNKEINRLIKARVLPRRKYYFVSLFADSDGKFQYQTMSKWVGFTKEQPQREIREASLVNAINIRSYFKTKGEPAFVINTKDDLQLFILLIGGHGIIEEELAKKLIHSLLQPQTFSFTFDDGWVSTNSIPKEKFNRAADPKLRMKVLNRDKRRCMICGASPANNEHVELHLHHIIPFGVGGITDENNLITVCHTCHKGLYPEMDYSLFDIIGVRMFEKRLLSDSNPYKDKIQWNIYSSLRHSSEKKHKRKN